MTQDTETTAADDPRYLSRERGNAVATRGRAYAHGGGETSFYLRSWWEGAVRFARNRVVIAADTRSLDVMVMRDVRDTHGNASTDQVDDASLERTVRTAERFAEMRRGGLLNTLPKFRPSYRYASPMIWSDGTAKQSAEERERVARTMIDVAESQGLLAAGSVEVTVGGTGFNSDDRPDLYCPITRAECSLTVRDPKASASGWAGVSSFDWARIDSGALVARAVEKCLKSRNPVAVEPGRWTVILEPQAVFDFISPLMMSFDRDAAETFATNPFHLRGTKNKDDSKIGYRVANELVTITHDIMDPDLGVVPFNFMGDPYTSVKLIENGMLTGLSYDRWYALEKLHEDEGYLASGAFKLHGGTATIDEMVQNTPRGLLVTRFSGVFFDPNSGLATGTTRDGIWLIERGKIVKPVKNFRFVEGPLFILNNVEQLGQAVPVYSAKGNPAVVPPMKARDFNMVALADAF